MGADVQTRAWNIVGHWVMCGQDVCSLILADLLPSPVFYRFTDDTRTWCFGKMSQDFPVGQRQIYFKKEDCKHQTQEN